MQTRKLALPLIVGAVGCFLAAPAVHAQASNVTLYGALILDTEGLFGLKQDNTSGTPGTPAPGSKENVYRVTSNISRFGIRGIENLGGGVRALFQFESLVNAAASGGTLASRDTFVALQSEAGTLKIGNFFTPYYDTGFIFGNVPTFRSAIFASASLWANNGYTGANVQTGSFGQRVANSIRYDSPNIGGFIGSAMISARNPGGDNGGDTAQQRRHAYVVSAAGQYNNGPLALGLGYETHNNLREGTVANPHMQDQGITATGSYKFGSVKVAAAWEGLKYTVPTGGDLKRNYWAVAATTFVGPGELYLAYWKANSGSGSAKCATINGITTCPRVGAATLGPDTGAQQFEITYTYALSKRTLLWGGFTMINNERNAAYNYGFNPVPGLCTGNARNAQGDNVGCGDSSNLPGIALGIAHMF